jgi:hypothetical protein
VMTRRTSPFRFICILLLGAGAIAPVTGQEARNRRGNTAPARRETDRR